MTINVNPDSLFNASVRFLDLRSGADRLLGALIAELGPTAGMSGADRLGGAFAERYDKAARQAAEGIAKIDIHLGQIASGLLASAANYWQADAASNMEFPIDTQAPAQKLSCDNAYAFRAEDVAAAQGAGIDVWDVIADTALAYLWPQGDTGKMRQAADVWLKVAGALNQLNLELSHAVVTVTTANSGPSISAFADHCRQLTDTSTCYSAPTAGGAAVPNLQALCGQIANFCHTTADAIDHARDEVKWLLIGAGIVTVAGTVIAIFTFGIAEVPTLVIDGEIIVAAEGVIATAYEVIIAEMIADFEALLATEAATWATTAALTTAGVVVLGGVIVFGADGTAYANPAAPNMPGSPVTQVPSYPPLTPAEQATFAAWALTLNPHPENGVGPEYDYQRRVAGPLMYYVPTGLPPPHDHQIEADGLRLVDGAMVEAKYTNDPSCSPYNLDSAATMFAPLYDKVLGEQDNEIMRYTAALQQPGNQAHFLEVDVNDPALVPYYQVLLAKYNTEGRVVYIP